MSSEQIEEQELNPSKPNGHQLSKEESKCSRYKSGECTETCYICIDAFAKNFGLSDLNSSPQK